MNLHILRFDEIDSTNSEAMRQARSGAPEGTCIIAAKQTAGRGRYGRTWRSEAGAGLYFSIVLRPALEMGLLPLVTLMAGVAVHQTMSDLGLSPDIKWVNDVLIGDKKISGILCEAIDTPMGTSVIVGIGINLMSTQLADELASVATSLEAELGSRVPAEELAKRLTSNLSRCYDLLSGPDGPAALLREWELRSTYFRGKPVRATLEGEVLNGVTDGLEFNGALRIITRDGSVRIIQTGDVQRLRANSD